VHSFITGSFLLGDLQRERTQNVEFLHWILSDHLSGDLRGSHKVQHPAGSRSYGYSAPIAPPLIGWQAKSALRPSKRFDRL